MGSVTVVGSSLFSVSGFLLPLFSFISSFLLRLLHGNGGSSKQNFDHSEIISGEKINQKDFEYIEPELESNDVGFKESEPELALKPERELKADEGGFTESEDDREFSFTFRFPTFEEFSKSIKKDNGELFNSDSVSSASFNNKTFKEQSKEKSVDDGEETQKNEATNSNLILHDDLSNEIHFNYHKQDGVVVTDGDSDSESTKFEPQVSVGSDSIDSDSYNVGFLSDEDFGDEFKVDDLDDASMDVKYSRGEMSDWDGDGEDSDILDELSKLQGEVPEHNPEAMTSQFLSEEHFHEDSDEADKDDKPTNGSHDSEKLTTKGTCDLEDSNKLETLWEHQDLIEQLKMELRKVRATGLPTILEESEPPKIMEDLKPWKIDDKFQREDCMDELHKFYKRYSERMRKFDIFNYQKMYAIGFLQLKDPLQPISSPKTSVPTLNFLLSQNFGQLKHKSIDNEPMIKFMKELQSDLEVVYVGHMCLSWEFLHWQYGKALDLWDSDPRGNHRYNEVAGEFQQFQVLMQRFIEDEHFQGPRVQYYIKGRCLLRNLLQVPVIREDNLEDRRKGRKGERAEYVITSDVLVEIIEEAIRIFWRFVRADKDCNNAISKGHKGTPAQLQNPGDLELMMEIRRTLHKKERKLKDLVRGGNCILRRFRNCREDDSDHVLNFFSQVDMKLVSRVLNMARITTDQLVWCHSKLSRIRFENRKIRVEPSFLLFPC